MADRPLCPFVDGLSTRCASGVGLGVPWWACSALGTRTS